MRKFSFFEVPSDFENDILRGLSDVNWNDNRVNVEVSQAPRSKSSSGGGTRRGRSDGRNRKFLASRKRNSSKSRNGERTDSRRSTSSRRRGVPPSISRSSEERGSSFKGRFNAATKRGKRV
jgi:hypothetical protein